MMMSASWRSTQRIGVLLLGLFLVCGCKAQPELRAIDEKALSVSITAGRQLLDQGKAVEAVVAFRRLLSQEGPDLKVLNGLAIAYSELGQTNLAAEMFARALEVSPNDPATLNNIGFAALRRADAGLARRYLEKARAQNADFAEIKGNLQGLSFLESGHHRNPASSRVIQAALTVPDQPAARTRRPPLQDSDQKVRSKKPEPPKAIPTTPLMIDFTDVIDPFSKRRTNEMPRP